LLLAEQGDPARACVYFGVIGALLLEHHHQLRAAPIVGMAAYRLGDQHLAFADPSDGVMRANLSGFHCWVETDDSIIDFQAPLFADALARQDPSRVLPRRMMQKSLATASAAPIDLTTGGECWHQADRALHMQLLTEFVERQANQDLARIANQWYQPGPGELRDAIEVGDGRGRVKRVPLSPIRVDGAW
jgi:hypothetical protein